MTFILKGWPDTIEETPHCIRPYWTTRDELSVVDGIIYNGMRIVVPPSMRSVMLAQIHESHLGVTKFKQRAREALYWPGINQQIENIVNDCIKCNSFQNKQDPESLIPTPIPNFPWNAVASDIFELEHIHYLLTMAYYFKFIEVNPLHDLSGSATIDAIKSQFSCHGIPEKLKTDNGHQFSSREFSLFCEDYQIEHTTSSPHYPQSNGEAERGVQIVKTQ